MIGGLEGVRRTTEMEGEEEQTGGKRTVRREREREKETARFGKGTDKREVEQPSRKRHGRRESAGGQREIKRLDREREMRRGKQNKEIH